ncbi:aminomethyl-transferring glycine dehydrogenase subunit GcvPB [Chlorobium phaeobacteroides]|jgi:glycine dehydrogenase subunit 2|uniref:Probable glycine dehydrogenase (decarboxylating) subunit 2 n=1 Tax=Chlorobium phaeobacteroides (strain DSM 266 / SMG 266 / 2430) TaxID=290317 RepID=GCSPB_CHLPD|nr:aminomethyl-transferring glycine dehydrogenase subunit GcvPB [Chlorobium phaeobacteroides]A1BJA7.1 RecName: Full=Probable glycine dehydrogenase (decarboxylating) subunit 2; AltName: Full=Glycine cleavage system P-protein subunit 2; AltName: Full=Glycine decarboxylase subunit 2; AltName: Full=Glycine dehydrogenase (aminomethyl-transferring) subunit 2 [Chlorobium phaeobacteroides DSM 266]ABL66484.1 glycine dehydrogenase (decarboxylating) beta subunit [Chlorobium phaeobacteroides DSM 266]MBV5319
MREKLIFDLSRNGRKGYSLSKNDLPETSVAAVIPSKFLRTTPAELPEVPESEVVRHFIRLSNLNYHVDKNMYPLGSCTMKYNPKVNDYTCDLPGFSTLHPLQPSETTQGALRLMYELSSMLSEIAGMAAVSLQPAAGAHGELTGILLIKKYHEAQGKMRNKLLVVDSAHGTNPASAAIAGYEIISVRSNADGRTDLEDLKARLQSDVAALMLTNPNTIGLFEKDILAIERMVHENGSLLYMDGANMNALLGITRPGDMGFDVVHYNLHKTFSAPHGGGGPGSGPIGVSARLAGYLPVPVIEKEESATGTSYRLNYDRPESIGRMISFYGNFSVLVRAYTYIRMLGPEGLRRVSENAIINANYLLSLLLERYDLPYPKSVMHEFCLSGDRQKKANGVKTLDMAKRLLDYGFHAPTIYFPLIVSEALMIEPTETETKETLERFAEAMIAIADEAENNPALVKSAPETTPVKRLDEAQASRQLNICCSL